MGLGLFRDFSDRMDADVWIMSGEALLHRRTAAGRRVSTVKNVSRFGGAWICMDAPASLP